MPEITPDLRRLVMTGIKCYCQNMPSGLVLYFTAINILNYLDRALVISVLPILMREMSLTNEQGGRLVSAFVLGYFVFSPIFGYLGDRFRRPPLMALGVLLWSLATIATGLADTMWPFIVARVLVGVGEASFGSIAPGYLKDEFQDPIRVNRALSLYYTAIPVGYALGYLTGGQLAQSYDWRMAFYVGGIPGILFAISLLFLEEKPRVVKKEQGGFGSGLKEIARIPIIWYAIVGYCLQSFALSGLAAFMVTYGESIGFDIASINRYFGLITVVGGFLGTIIGGRISSRLAARSSSPTFSMLGFVGVTALLGVPFLLGAFLVENHYLFLALALVAELLIFAGTAPVNSILVLSCPPALVTLTQGLSIFCLNLFGSLLAPVLVGVIADQSSLRIGMLSCGIALLLAGLTWSSGAAILRRSAPAGGSAG